MSSDVHQRGTRLQPRRWNLLVLPIVLLAIGSLVGCEGLPGTSGATSEIPVEADSDGESGPKTAGPPPVRDWALVVHGGLSTGSEDADTARVARLVELAEAGATRLADGEAALQVVTDLLVELESDPRFNAGVGSTYNRRGVHEMSAALMDGRTRAFGAVGGLRNLRSPIGAARGALETHQGGHLMSEAADDLGRALSLPRAPQDFFSTRERFVSWRSFREQARRVERDGGRLVPPIDPTGALALDSFGNLAAGVSFGGHTDGLPEQPTALATIGPGVYADNGGAAVIAVGTEERLLSCQFPSLVAARTKRADSDLDAVLRTTVEQCPGSQPHAILAIDGSGHIAILAPDDGPSLLLASRQAALPATGRE